MAKKSRKTRKDKTVAKKHEFNPWITPKAPAAKSKGKTEDTAQDRNKPQIPEYVYKDFKKISLIMGCFIVGVLILAIIAYHTSLFNPVFNIFHIKY